MPLRFDVALCSANMVSVGGEGSEGLSSYIRLCAKAAGKPEGAGGAAHRDLALLARVHITGSR